MGVPYSEDCCDDVEIAAEVEWSNISNVPSYITTDWSVDQGDTNIDANNIPLLSYAPNTLAANGTPGLSNFNFNQTRKQKLDTIANAAQVNVQANWDETDNTSDSYIHSKPTLFSGSYNDLDDKPTLFSGSYTNLLNVPTNLATTSDLASKQNTIILQNNAVNPLDTSQVGSLSFGSGANANTLIYTPATPVITVTTHLAPLASPALTGTPTVNGQVIKVNTGDGALTEKNFTTALQTKLAGIADNADVTPSWVPPSDPGYQTVSDVTAAISGKQDTLSNGVGVSIQNNSVNIAQDVGPSSNVQFGGLTLSGGISSAGTLQIYDRIK